MKNFVTTSLLGALIVFLEAQISSSVLQNNEFTEKFHCVFSDNYFWITYCKNLHQNSSPTYWYIQKYAFYRIFGFSNAYCYLSNNPVSR